jgi:hypothetical protein
MSYEGYSQFLCKYGHYWETDCNCVEGTLKENVCPVGLHPAVWENMVNVTNGTHEDDGTRIDGYIELKERSRRTCKHCGTVTELRYKIPEAGVKKGESR